MFNIRSMGCVWPTEALYPAHMMTGLSQHYPFGSTASAEDLGGRLVTEQSTSQGTILLQCWADNKSLASAQCSSKCSIRHVCAKELGAGLALGDLLAQGCWRGQNEEGEEMEYGSGH